MKKEEVLIIGAGPTGLVMAAELARHGVKPRIIDLERGPTDKSKAIGIQSRTMETFEIMGIAGKFKVKGLQVQAANIYDGGRQLVHLDFSELGNDYPYLLLIPQAETEAILLTHLLQYGIVIERNTGLQSLVQNKDNVKATLKLADGTTEEVQTKWLVGCDGAHSTVRHLLKMPFEGSEYEDGFQLADVNISWPLNHKELHIIIYQGWLLAAFPLSGEGNRYRLIADLQADKAPLDKVPSLAEIQAIVDERSHVKAILSDPKWTANYRIHRRIVKSLRDQRVFLAGDAAHIHSPAAAQGMNTGIQDVFNLAWKLALVVNDLSPETILQSYHQERYPVEKGVLKTTDLLLKMVSISNPVGMSVRDALLPFLTGFGPVKKMIRENISEISIDYEDSDLVENHNNQSDYKAGERLPDTSITVQGKNQETSIYSLLTPGKHLLMLFTGKHKQAEDIEYLRQARLACADYHRQIQTCLIKRAGMPEKKSADNFGFELDDNENKIHQTYNIERACIMLIRPDGYIGFCAGAQNGAEKLPEYLSSRFKKAAH